MAGCVGYVGEAFYKQFKGDFELKCTKIDVNKEWLTYLDFRDFESYKRDVVNFQPEWLFHIGAYTDLEYCEMHGNKTYLTNTESVKHALKIANEI